MSKSFFAALGSGIIGLAAGVSAALHACVPADTRPPPGTLTLTVSPSAAVVNGSVTVDGWALSFERVLIGIGQASLDDRCLSYSEANYGRILNVTEAGTQKLSILHGLGQCDVRFRISPPSTDSVLGAGTTEADRTELRTPGGDFYVPLGGVSVDITGSATLANVTKHFHFTFRPRVRYRECTIDADAGAGEGGPAVNLESNVDLTYDIRIEAEALFRDDDTPSLSSLRFAPFANADTNHDDIVTLDELRAVPISVLRDGGAFEAGTYDFDDAGVARAGRAVTIENLGDYVYIVLMPRIPRFRDIGKCTPNIQLTQGRGN